jgi:hypothetical protein
MLVLALAVAIALLLPLLTGGSYTRLVMTGWRWGGLLFAGLVIQLALEYIDIPESRWHDVGFGLLVASYVLILGFCAGNVLLRGMTIVLIGVACNFLVIVVNQGMAVRIPDDWKNEAWVTETIKHHPERDDDQLMVLSDIIVLRSPFDAVLSFGDLILAVGLCDVTYWASRKTKRVPSDPNDPREPPATQSTPERVPRRARGKAQPAVDLSAYTPEGSTQASFEPAK